MLANTGPFPGIILNYIIHMECNMTTFSSSSVPLTLNKNSDSKRQNTIITKALSHY